MTNPEEQQNNVRFKVFSEGCLSKNYSVEQYFYLEEF